MTHPPGGRDPLLHTIPASSVPTVSAAQMAEVDRIVVQERALLLVQMMENAGRALATLTRQVLGGDVAGRRVLVLAGSGGNGGGALAAAHRLHVWGAEPVVLTSRDTDTFTGVPAHQLDTLGRFGVPVHAPGAMVDAAPHDVVLDGLIGYSLSGPPRGATAGLIDLANTSPAPVVSLDCPSGLDVDTGQTPGAAVTASATLTLALPKPGLVNPTGRHWVGELYLADIGIPADVYTSVGVTVGPIFARADLLRLTPTDQDLR
jgi:NAD(P)H-hydrate epimerase